MWEQGKRDTAGEKLNVGEAGFWRIKGNKGSATKKAVMLNSFSASAPNFFCRFRGKPGMTCFFKQRCHAEFKASSKLLDFRSVSRIFADSGTTPE